MAADLQNKSTFEHREAMNGLSALLVIGDAQRQRHWRQLLQGASLGRIAVCTAAGDARRIIGADAVDLVYIDLRLDDMAGIELARQIKATRPSLHLLMGGESQDVQNVVEAMQAGAADFIVDPFDDELVQAAFDNAARRLVAEASPPPAVDEGEKTIITQDPRLLGLLDMARKVAPSTATVLVTGESGTGKELLASFIHANSRREGEPYVAVNCAALPEQLAESELFGHEKGAFTGALSRRAGKFESAGKGTLVLDEVTEMALPLQAKLLRALQEREVVRLGSHQPVPVQARVVAISNQNLRKAVASGAFREDLYFRLNVIPLTIPPLRERKNDIPLLADHFLKRFSSRNGTSMATIAPEALRLLTAQQWPGNIRELENTIERAVLIGSGPTLLPEHLILEPEDTQRVPETSAAAGTTVREMEKTLIFNTLTAVNDNRTHAAKMLGISIRTLRNKLNEYREEMAGADA